MIHALLALGTCVIIVLTGLNWAACFWSAAFYLGRELAQAEYRYIEAHGKKRANCPWYCGLCPSAWTSKSVIDCLLPWVVCLAAAIIDVVLRGW